MLNEQKIMELKVDIENPKTASLTIDDIEIQVLILALSWAEKKSIAKKGAQTKKIIKLHRRLRELYHKWLSLKHKAYSDDDVMVMPKKNLADAIEKDSAAMEKAWWAFTEDEEE